jgi:hypothetical protein
MILIDYSQVAISNLHQQLKGSGGGYSPHHDINDPTTGQLQPDLLRHMILNSIRRTNREFGSKYGRIVICTDNQNYWRKGYFRNYKANRKKTRDASEIDWRHVFEVLHQLRDEIRDIFPYKVMNVPMAEADDVIGVICKNFCMQERILIYSGDKDFMQLQAYPNIEQYSPTKNEYLTTEDPELFLREHIIRGDVGDGVPNYLSPDDVFVSGGRQRPILTTKVEVWVHQKPEEFCDENTLKNYERNRTLVDLNQIPVEVQTAILEEFKQPILGDVSKIYGYLVKHRMRNLLELIREF